MLEQKQKELPLKEVESVKKERERNGKIQFLVQWKRGTDLGAPTWEYEENLNCPGILDEFRRKNLSSRKGPIRHVAGDKSLFYTVAGAHERDSSSNQGPPSKRAKPCKVR